MNFEQIIHHYSHFKNWNYILSSAGEMPQNLGRFAAEYGINLLYFTSAIKKYKTTPEGLINASNESIEIAIVQRLLDFADSKERFKAFQLGENELIEFYNSVNTNLNIEPLINLEITEISFANHKLSGAIARFEYVQKIQRKCNDNCFESLEIC